MDIYGIGASLSAHMRNYTETHKGTGRTSTLLSVLREGDAVVFSLPSAKSHFERELQEAGFERGDIDIITASPHSPSDISHKMRGTPKGKIYFDHSYLEEFYAYAVHDAAAHIHKLSTELSGYGEAHRKTRAQAKAIHKGAPRRRDFK